MSKPRLRRIDYKTRYMKGLMFKAPKIERKPMSQTERELFNRILELELRVERLEKRVKVLWDKVFQKVR